MEVVDINRPDGWLKENSDNIPDIIASTSVITNSLKESFYHGFLNSSWQVMRQLRKSFQLCDVVINCGSKVVHAHRIVLASVSPYFKALFLGLFAAEQSTSYCFQTELNHFSESAVELLIDLIYKEDIALGEFDVVEMIRLADYLHIDVFVDFFINIARGGISLQSCLHWYCAAVELGIERWSSHLLAYIGANFKKLISENLLPFMPHKLFRQLLVSPHISCFPSDILIDSVLSWTAGVDERCLMVEELLADVKQFQRLTLLSMQRIASFKPLSSLAESANIVSSGNRFEGTPQNLALESTFDSVLMYGCKSNSNLFPLKDIMTLDVKSMQLRYHNYGLDKSRYIPNLRYFNPDRFLYFSWRYQLFVLFTERDTCNVLIIQKYNPLTAAMEDHFVASFETLFSDLSNELTLSSCCCARGMLYVFFKRGMTRSCILKIRLSDFTVESDVIRLNVQSELGSVFHKDTLFYFGEACIKKINIRDSTFTTYFTARHVTGSGRCILYQNKIYCFMNVKKSIYVLRLNEEAMDWVEVEEIQDCRLSGVFVADNRLFIAYHVFRSDQHCCIVEHRCSELENENCFREEQVIAPIFTLGEIGFVPLPGHILV